MKKESIMEQNNTNHESRTTNHDGEATLSFEAALAQLQDLVKKMESGALPLADSVAAYETGMKLKAYLEQMLKEAELKIEKLKIES